MTQQMHSQQKYRYVCAFFSVSIRVNHLCVLISVLLRINFYDFKRVYYELVTATIILQANSLAHRSMLLLIA